MSLPRALTASVALLAAAAAAAAADASVDRDDAFTEISDELYYTMPRLFHLDDYEGCLATRGVYCLGSFELYADSDHQLYGLMQRYSSNWVDHYNHTRLHRGLCVSRRCPHLAPHHAHQTTTSALDAWFASCVNASTTSEYRLSARLYRLEYCRRGPVDDHRPLTDSERAFAGLLAALLALAAISTTLDFTLPDHTKKGADWALSWSARGCWRALLAPPPVSREADLRAFDGLRVLCMLSVIIEHVCWLNTLSYAAQPRYSEVMRREPDVMLMTNSTLVVQIFFLMASFLLAHKLLQQRRRQEHVPPFSTFVYTMINRIIRVSPSYFVMVWFAASWWSRLGRGPMWTPLVDTEVAICQKKWWTHLLYLNNMLYADDKCLIQTWYLAADMQLYAVSLILTLLVWRWKKGAIYILTALLIGSISLLFGLAYTWRLVPTFVMHRPELVRAAYAGESSFNVLYQSPLGNVPGALAGLLLAHVHHAALDAGLQLKQYKVFRWVSVWATPLAVWWAAWSPRLLGPGAPPRLAAAALAALERPLFAFFVALALLGAMHDVQSPWGRCFSWRGWRRCARLSFGALLLHLPLNKTLVAARLAPAQLDRQNAIFEWFGVAVVSYAAALPLALLVELPPLRLHRALAARAARAPRTPRAHPPAPAPTPAPRTPPPAHAHTHAHDDNNNNDLKKTDVIQ